MKRTGYLVSSSYTDDSRFPFFGGYRPAVIIYESLEGWMHSSGKVYEIDMDIRPYVDPRLQHLARFDHELWSKVEALDTDDLSDLPKWQDTIITLFEKANDMGIITYPPRDES